jgi:hypothetical protein
MDKMNHTAYVWKADKRMKSGERLVSTTVWRDRDALTVIREVEAVWPPSKFRIEVVPTMKTVVNLMSGKEIEIPHDTPRSCDPSSELYWSM